MSSDIKIVVADDDLDVLGLYRTIFSVPEDGDDAIEDVLSDTGVTTFNRINSIGY